MRTLALGAIGLSLILPLTVSALVRRIAARSQTVNS
jgi:hypothetical protein